MLAATGPGDETTTVGRLHEEGHPEPWIVALDAAPTRARVLDAAARGAIEPTCSDVTGRGGDLEDAQLERADRLERRVLIMALAMDWRVRVGRDEVLNSPTPLEKTHRDKATSTIGASGNVIAA